MIMVPAIARRARLGGAGPGIGLYPHMSAPKIRLAVGLVHLHFYGACSFAELVDDPKGVLLCRERIIPHDGHSVREHDFQVPPAVASPDRGDGVDGPIALVVLTYLTGSAGTPS
jgi:hypothetical protein